MARVKQRVTKTTKTRTRKVPSGNIQCNMCHGKGYYKKPNRKKS